MSDFPPSRPFGRALAGNTGRSMGAVVDLRSFTAQRSCVRRWAACAVAPAQYSDTPDDSAPSATLRIDGETFVAPVAEVESMRPGDIVDVGFLAVVIGAVAFRDGRICVSMTKRLAYGRLRLVQG